MNGAYEPVVIRQRAGVDDDGRKTPPGPSTEKLCRVQPLVLDQDIGTDREGTREELRVFAPAGTDVTDESEARIRGRWYRVTKPPHDYAAYRRPVLARRHRPSVVFVCERGAG